MANGSGFYSRATTIQTPQDCLYENMNNDTSHTSTRVDMPGYDGFPLGTTCYTPTSYFHPPFSTRQPSNPDFIRQAACSRESYLRMPLAGSADHGRPRLRDGITDSGPHSISFNRPLDTELYSSPSSSGLLFKQSMPSTPSLSASGPAASQLASSASVQQPSHQGRTPSSKRKRKISDSVHENLMLRDREQRVSKRARVPASSVRILSFEDEADLCIVRESRTNSEKESMQELALIGGSCTRCAHAKKKVRFLDYTASRNWLKCYT